MRPNPTAEELRALPDEKLEELAEKLLGKVGDCPECGEYTAFPSTPGHNDEAECHECGYRYPV